MLCDRRLIAATAGLLMMTAAARAAVPPPAWWTEARFGLFIHWGLYAVPAGRWPDRAGRPGDSGGAGEWLMHDAKVPVAEYAKLAGRFNPTAFDADAWAALAQSAGMRYVVITAKHHDGFAMFHTKVDGFNIVDATPFKRDPIAELSVACRKRGLRFGVYYSQAQDWHHPGGAAAGGHWDPAQDGDFDAYLRTVAQRQVRELMDQYRPAVVWWDTPYDMTAARAAPLADLLSASPGIVSNDRLGGDVRADYATPEQRIPPNGYGGRPWETCMTINDTWGYKADDHDFKSATQLARDLIDIASKGGNFLLNVGPDATGVIPAAEADRLRTVGGWLAANGEAVYGTTAGPFARPLPFGRATRRGNTLYLAVFDRPADGVLRLPLHNGVAGAHLLSDPAPLPTTTTADGVTVGLPPGPTGPIATVVVLQLDGPPQPFAPPIRPAADGSLTLTAADATIDGHAARLEDRGNQPNIGYWSDPHDVVRWTVDLPHPAALDVEVTYSAEEKSSLALTAHGDLPSGRRDGTLRPTGGWDAFRRESVAPVTVPAGPTELTLARTGAAVNVRSVRLVPRPGGGEQR